MGLCRARHRGQSWRSGRRGALEGVEDLVAKRQALCVAGTNTCTAAKPGAASDDESHVVEETAVDTFKVSASMATFCNEDEEIGEQPALNVKDAMKNMVAVRGEEMIAGKLECSVAAMRIWLPVVAALTRI